MSSVSLPPILSTGEYTIGDPVAVLRESTLVDKNGNPFVVDKAWLDGLCNRMNQREYETGDLAPFVIGHTPDEEHGYVKETDLPEVVGYARTWYTAPLGRSGQYAAFTYPWIKNECRERVKAYPRRSGEVWLNRQEIDPISLLGARTPHQDLGMMKLSADSSNKIAVPSPENETMPDTAPETNPANTGENVEIKGMISQLLAMQQQMLQAIQSLSGAGAPGAEGGAGAPGAEGAPGGGELSDEEIEKLLSEVGGAGSEKPMPGKADGDEEVEPDDEDEKPVKAYASPGGTTGNVRLSRLEDENRELRVRLARQETLAGLKAAGITVRDNDPLVSDLLSMPSDIRDRQIARMKLARPSEAFTAALDAASGTAPKRLSDLPEDAGRSEVARIAKLARSRNQTFEIAAKAEGYVI